MLRVSDPNSLTRGITAITEGAIVRHAIILLTMLIAGGLSCAFADPPATAPASGAKASASAPAKAAPSASEEEKDLLAQGYKVRVSRGQKVYCKKEIPIGSTLPVMRCLSAEEAKRMANEGRELLEQQRGQGR